MDSQLTVISNENDVKALKELAPKKTRLFLGLRYFVHGELECLQEDGGCKGLTWDNGEHFDGSIYTSGINNYMRLVRKFFNPGLHCACFPISRIQIWS